MLNFSRITKNHLADPEIGFYVCVRLFLKEKKNDNKGNRTREMNFFGVKEFFHMNFDFNNGCKNELKDNKEKS